MTIIFTLVGILVFFISLISTKLNFKTSFVRLLMFTGAGLVIDCLLITYGFLALNGYYL